MEKTSTLVTVRRMYRQLRAASLVLASVLSFFLAVYFVADGRLDLAFGALVSACAFGFILFAAEA